MNDSTAYTDGLKSGLEDHTKAEHAFSQAVEANPGDGQAYLMRGVLRYKLMKKYKEAKNDLDKAVELMPESPEAFLHRGTVQCHLTNFSEAAPDFDRSIELNPFNEKTYINRGKARFLLKWDEQEVRSDFETAIKLGAPYAADMIKLFYS